MRLFVAVDLDLAAKTSIGSEQSRLRDAARDSRLRWVRPEHMHLTLVFLGEIADNAAAAIVSACGADVAQPPFEVAFGGLGVFPPRGAPRALWVGAAEGSDELRALQREMAQRVARLGVALDTRPFSPHLTLGRWKESRPSDRHLVDDASRATLARVRVDRATLYHSRLSSQGPSYTALSHANLTGR